MKNRTEDYRRLKAYIDGLHVIDCHEHTAGHLCAPSYTEPVASLIQGYIQSDLITAGANESEMELLNNQKITTEDKWDTFARLWSRTEHTAYAKVTKKILADTYGEKEVTLQAMQRIRNRLLNLRDSKIYYGILDKAKIRCRLVNIFFSNSDEDIANIKKFMEGSYKLSSYDRALIPLPMFHLFIRSRQSIERIAKLAATNITKMEDYLQACFSVFKKMKDAGAVGMKDQSAYERTLMFDNPSRTEAENIFNKLIAGRQVGWPESKPFDDYLFQRFMEMAAELNLPVQIHTGHMAGIRNEISKTNAVHLTPLFDLHRKVQFDIFHGNWPYAGELLFLAKNYPNVHINLCWTYIIDPVYAENLLYESLSTVPHSKIHGFGGDYWDTPEYSASHLSIAKEVIASALTKAINSGWLDFGQASQAAADWLFNNPNRFFNLQIAP